MGRVWSFSRWPLAVLLAMALLLVVAFRGDDSPAEATTFNISQTVSLSTNAAGANPTITTSTGLGPAPAQDAMFSAFFSFTPAAIVGAVDADILNGSDGGSGSFLVRLGAFNSQCVGLFGVSGLTWSESTTDRSGVGPPPGFSGSVDFVDTPADDGTGVLKGASGYPKRVAQQTPGGEARRFFSTTVVGVATQVDIHLLLYPPGGLGLPAALGRPSLLFFNTQDIGVPTPGTVTDSCPPFTSTVVISGVVADNPNTTIDEGDGANHPNGTGAQSTNPGPGTQLFFNLGQSERDADNDGIDVSDDTCQYAPNVGDPYNLLGLGGFDPISDIGEFLTGGLPFADGIDAACDADGALPPFFVGASSCGPGAGDDHPITTGPFGSDCDSDGFANRGDNCPQVSNASQLNSELLRPIFLTEDGGPKQDDTGDACDINYLDSHGDPVGPAEGVSDGHYHQTLGSTPVCITSPAPVGDPLPAGLPWFADLDGDGWCNIEEAGLSSDLANSGSTPEFIGIPTTCDNGVDDDGILGIDLADAKCAAGDGSHDIQIKKFVGTTTVNPGQSAMAYNLQLRNKSGVAETVSLGISVTATSSGCWPMAAQVSGGPVVNAVGGGDGILGTVDLGSNPNSTTPVQIKVYIDGNCPAAAVGTALYTVAIDVCHGNDPAPLGLFGSASCPGPPGGDGNQDRALPLGANDAPVSITVTQAP